MKKKTKKQLEEEIEQLEIKNKQHRESRTNSETWHLSGYYNYTMPGGGERHPLDYD